MKSLFDIKNPLSFDSNIFDKMKNTAVGILQRTEKKQYAQAIVILTTKGNEYSSFIANAVSTDKIDEKILIDRLADVKDTEINRILCLWQNGEADIPSFDFRNMLCQLNSANLNAGIFVMTNCGYSVIKLGTTLK